MADTTPVTSVEGGDEVQATNNTNTPATTPSSASSGTFQAGSMGQLKAQYPEFYNALMQGVAWNCIHEQEKANRHFKEVQRYGSRQS